MDEWDEARAAALTAEVRSLDEADYALFLALLTGRATDVVRKVLDDVRDASESVSERPSDS